MPTNRTLSLALRKQLFQPFREKDIRVLLTIDHADFIAPYRFVSGDPNEFASLVSNGNTFQTFPFELGILSDDDNEPEAFIRLMNVDDRIGTVIRELSSETVTITAQIVLRETPDNVEYEAVNMELVDVVENSIELTGRIVSRGLATEPCPGRLMSLTISPAFFR